MLFSTAMSGAARVQFYCGAKSYSYYVYDSTITYGLEFSCIVQLIAGNTCYFSNPGTNALMRLPTPDQYNPAM